MFIEYFLLGVLKPIFLNLMDLVIGIYVVVQRGSIMSLGFSGVGFLTKSIAMIFFVWLGVQKIELDYQIFVPMITFFGSLLMWFTCYSTLHTKERTQTTTDMQDMSNEVLSIIINYNHHGSTYCSTS